MSAPLDVVGVPSLVESNGPRSNTPQFQFNPEVKPELINEGRQPGSSHKTIRVL